MNDQLASVGCDPYESSRDLNLAAKSLLSHEEQYLPIASNVLNLPRAACAASVGLIMSLSSVTAIHDVWSDDRRCRDTATLTWIFGMPIGNPISRRQALLLARQILEEAEQHRADFIASEARQGIQWGHEG